MRCFLPIPYADELLYSVESRYVVRISLPHKGRLGTHIFNRDARPYIYLPSSLDIVSEKTSCAWNKNGAEIARELTLFPYYTRYLRDNLVTKCMKIMLSAAGHGLQFTLGIAARNIKVPRYLRFCKTCRRIDVNTNGETYWHRSHQLPGVLICPDHGEQLIDSSALTNPKGFGDYIDATEATVEIKLRPVKALNINEHKKAFKISRRSRDMLMGPISGWDGENVTQAYRRGAIERGFIEGATQLSLSKLEKKFLAYYGKRLLSMLQCDFRAGDNGSWFRNIFRSSQKNFHPLEHALVQIYLENKPVTLTDRIPFGLGPWRCPNPYGKHEEEFPITNPQIYIGHKHRKYVASAKCSCEFHFTFQSVSETDLQMPVVSKVMQYGPTWEVEVRHLRKSGLSILAIAKKMGVYDSNIRSMLQTKRRVNRVTPQKIEHWRKEWLKLLEKVPNRSRKLAAKRSRGLYIRLLRNDRNWILPEPRRWDRSVKPPRYIDWAGRDKRWSEMLKRAAEATRKAVPLRKSTRTAMIKEAGLGLKILAKYDKYPRCKSVLDKYSESTEAYRERRETSRSNGNIELAA